MNKIDKDKQYTTRDGREVRIYATDGRGVFPVHGAIKDGEGWSSFTWANNGSSVNSASRKENPDDLIEVKRRKKIERWIMVERHDACSMWITKPSHIETANSFALKHIVFEVEEGEGLDAV
jgi:hypothetical protein